MDEASPPTDTLDDSRAGTGVVADAFESDRTEKVVDVSIVIPVLDEEESLPYLFEALGPVLDDLDHRSEVIIVDDGSSDGSWNIIEGIHRHDDRVIAIRLRRNFGQTAAFSAGFEAARGEVIVTLDADLQNDPGDIPRLLEKMGEGYDLVSGWRVNRQDPWLTRRFPSRVANWLISRLTGVELHDYGCSLKAYRRMILENVRLYGELHRFIPALASWMGIRVAEIKVNHSPREHGHSKYGLGRVSKVLLDLVTVKFLLDYASRPIQIFGMIGLICFGAGTLLGLYLTVQKFLFQVHLADRPILMLVVLLIVLGVQFITMGLLGELVMRSYYETKDKPTYLVRERLDRGDLG